MSIVPSTTVLCLDCDEEIELDEESQAGDIIVCGECEAQMELVSVSPVRLVFFFGDDWDDADTEDDADGWGAY